MNSHLDSDQQIVFATFAESDEQLRDIQVLVESIREFAGALSRAPVRVYLFEDFKPAGTEATEALSKLHAEFDSCSTPAIAGNFYFSGKVFAAAAAEATLAGHARLLVWLDSDTVVLREPSDLLLADSVDFAYRPVMHNRSGTLYGQPPMPFWSRIYNVLGIDEAKLFPMVTPADRQKIRAYFNSGLLAVRPEIGVLRKWAEDFVTACADPALVEMCDQEITWKIFLHQAALVGAVVNRIERERMVELSLQYNYPMFFKVMFGGLEDFDSIDDVVTMRYDIYFRNPDPNWSQKLKGPADKIAWLKERLGR